MELQHHLASPFSGIALRSYEPSDDVSLAHILMDPRSWSGGMGPTYHTRIPESMDDALDAIQVRHATSIIYTITGPGGELIGTTGITSHIPAKARVQIGRTIIAPDYWGRGLNHEVKLIMLDWLFSMGAGRIELEVDSLNVNSLKSLTSFGFTMEGVRRRAVLAPDGRWKDMAIFSMVVEEWGEKREQAIVKITSRTRNIRSESPALIG